MHLAYDLRPFLSSATGVGFYIQRLLTAIVELPDAPICHLFTSSCKERFDPGRLPQALRRQLVDRRIPGRLLNPLWHYLRFPPVDWLLGHAIDLAHSPTPLILPSRGRSVITIHDLFFLAHPELTRGEMKRDYPRLLAASLRRADGVICVSQATRAALLDRFPGCAAKSIAIASGVGSEYLEPAAPAAVLPAGLPPRFILFCGTIEPRKNLPLLLGQLLSLRRRGIAIPLVIAGGRGWGLDEFLPLRLELGEQVVELGYTPSGLLPALYRSAAALVLPSLDEGFGFPVLEALASGTPVLCSDIPALREVGADQAVYFDLHRPKQLLEQLAALWRGELSFAPAAARSHAARFSWPATAAATLAFYRRVLS
jgi:glycosyltransferase involved in cell wall biosynthesis